MIALFDSLHIPLDLIILVYKEYQLKKLSEILPDHIVR